MKKNVILIFLLMVTFSVHAEKVTPYKGSRIFWDTTTRTQVFGGGQYARIIKLQDGRLMAATEWGGRINITFSRNLGRSWDGPTVIASPHDNINMCVPDLIQLTDGTIIVAYNPRPVTPFTISRKFGIRCKKSTDNGATWSDEIFVNDAHERFEDGCWEPSMLELPSGELQLYFADEGPYTSSNEQQISMCRSFDKGSTWSAPQKISFRAGFRDGMPVPILLKNKSEIVVAIEDNGWGYGDFFPTTVRCPLSTNWDNGFFVNTGSTYRDKTLDLSYTPPVTGGAPYLRALPNGETILSWQSAYKSNGVLKMWVAVGDEEARNFKALSTPFITPPAESVMWNSVAVVDTVVYAIGSTRAGVEMQKGYPKKQFEAPFGRPDIDGKQTRDEGYYTPNNAQIRMGTMISTVTTADFAYDRDSLYFFCRVGDKDVISTGAYQDLVRLSVDPINSCDTKPATGTFKYQFRTTGQITRYYGNGMSWRFAASDAPRSVTRVTSNYYIIEAAIPWTDMGIDAPAEDKITVNIEIVNGSATGTVTESIPDAKSNAPWTWMPLHLQDFATGIKETKTDAADDDTDISVNGETLNIKSSRYIERAVIYALDGKAVKMFSDLQNAFSAPIPMSGMAVIRLSFRDGTTLTRKIIL